MQIDPRGARFAASLTTLVLALALVSGSAWPLLLQVVVFAVGAFRGVQFTPYAALFRQFVRPRLAPPTALEDARPPQFAQSVGLGFGLVGLLGAAAGWTPLFLVATAFALAAAFLNAAFGFCLGCEVYLLIRRVRPGTTITPLNRHEEISA